MTKCWLAVTEKGKPIKKFPASVLKEGDIVKAAVKLKPSKVVKRFKSIPGKPAMRQALESVMLHYKGYDPSIHSVTVLPRQVKKDK